MDEDKENLPDNSCLQCNLCVTGLDESLTAGDIHSIFQQFGELKSCKVATDPKTGKSKCYGYVWFQTELGCSKALACTDLPYKVQLYKQYCLRALEPHTAKPSKPNTALISGYPRSFTPSHLSEMLGAEAILQIALTKDGAEVTFKSAKWYKMALEVDKTPIGENHVLRVTPLQDQKLDQIDDSESVNLYLKDLKKDATPLQVRRTLALFGRLQSFNLINKPEYSTNIAFATFASSSCAKRALLQLQDRQKFSETLGNFSVFPHKQK